MKVDKFRTVIIYIIIILLGLVCLLPLLNIVAISFSSSAAVEGNMVGLIPVGFSTAAYEKILEDSQFWHSFLISVERVVLTLIINFVLIVLMAYPLSKTNAQFRGRNVYANLMIFAMLFNGGMIPHLPACQILRPAQYRLGPGFAGSRAHLQCHPGDELLCCRSQRA